jgi:hypothetical protein
MRTRLAGLALGFTLGLAAPTLAQSGASELWPGVTPRKLTFTPINTSAAFKQYDFSNAFRPVAPPPPNNFMTFFHKFNPMNLWNWGKTPGSTTGNLSTPTQMPTIMPK